jgi:ATP-dependent DNA helicase RecQ
MAQEQPTTLAEFAKLSGVGSHKLAQYGDKFLTEIRAYRQEQGLVDAQDYSAPYLGIGLPTETELFTLQLHRQGLSVNQIAETRNIRPTTIIRHLSDLIEKNQPVDLNQLVTLERQQKIWQVLEVLGDISLTPIREQLGESYTYDEIRLVRGKWRRESRNR